MWVVMSGGGLGAKRSFETNATHIRDKETAEKIAAERNKVEKQNGNIDILWFPVKWPLEA